MASVTVDGARLEVQECGEGRDVVLVHGSASDHCTWEALRRMDDREIRSLDRPALLVGGERSPALFGRLLDHLETLLPDAERVTVPGASHLVHEDRPRPFARAVESFVDGLAA